MLTDKLLKKIIHDIRDDCVAMERCFPGGEVHGWASRFQGYATAIEGHVPNYETKPPEPHAAVDGTSEVDDDEDEVPVT